MPERGTNDDSGCTFSGPPPQMYCGAGLSVDLYHITGKNSCQLVIYKKCKIILLSVNYSYFDSFFLFLTRLFLFPGPDAANARMEMRQGKTTAAGNADGRFVRRERLGGKGRIGDKRSSE